MPTPQQEKSPKVKPQVVNLTGLLKLLYAQFDDGSPPETKLTVGDLMAAIGRRAYGPLLLFIGLFSISPASFITGMTWLSATIVLLIALQMLVGKPSPWLPRRLLRISLSRRLLFKGLDAMKPWARRIDRVLKPRLTFLTGWPFIHLVALVCIVAALVSYPAGLIPFAPFVPGMAIVLVGLGVTARDGVMLLLGAALAAAPAWFLVERMGWA